MIDTDAIRRSLAAKRRKGSAKRAIVIHLNAGNDSNGNPRRIYLAILSSGRILGAVDEGYSGSGAVGERWGAGAMDWPIVEHIATTPAERKRLLARYGG